MSEVFEQQPTTENNSKNITFTYGLITALAMIVLSIIIHLANLGMNTWVAYISYVIFFIGVFTACKAFTKSRNGFVTFGNVFGAGFKMVAFTTVLIVLWAVISVYVFPEIKTQAIEAAQTEMLESGISEEQLDMSLDMTEKFFTPLMIMGALFSNLIVGVIFALISAALVKKNKSPEPF